MTISKKYVEPPEGNVNEMIVRHLMKTPVACGDWIDDVAARLRYEREVWGLSRSLLF